MGETINHPFLDGHPGIDFQWYHHAVPLISSADGVISSISKHAEGGFELEIDGGWYRTGYLGIEVDPNLKSGQKIQKGDLVGEPYHATNLPDNNPNLWGFHWEFGYVSLLKNEICPLTYFDANSKERIEKI